MKSGDLIIVTVCHDHRLGGISAFVLTYKVTPDALRCQAVHVVGTVASQHSNRQWVAPQLAQAVSDIARTAAKLTAQTWHQKRHIQNMQLIGQDLLCESPLKVHDGVKSKRSTNQHRHLILNSFRDKKQVRGSQLPKRQQPEQRHSRLPPLPM